MLEKCKKDAMAPGMDGIVHIIGKKKLPYLSDKNYFEHMGFKRLRVIEDLHSTLIVSNLEKKLKRLLLLGQPLVCFIMGDLLHTKY